MKEKERAKQRVEELKQALADVLNNIEWKVDAFEFECEQMGLDSVISVQIQDACMELGFALATLVNWDKETGETK